ncbi:enoyl-CoA hydratase [Labrenzia aggregata]|uniref:Enoyl-CoA hydratase n=2 Tax=Roseibium aggregatum TaxID=187304 RepID=A0A939J2X6_9HYPH|nr:enoyl-CoA hydratase [Roseibium aggregatum]
MLHFEDFASGQSYDLGSLTVTKEDIVDYAAEFDPQPFHLDEDAGKASLLGGLAAAGLHSASLVMRLVATGLLNKCASRGSPGIDKLSWRRPVYPGDTLNATLDVLDTRALRSRPDLGMVFIKVTADNQNGKTVLRWENPILIAKRSPAP